MTWKKVKKLTSLRGGGAELGNVTSITVSHLHVGGSERTKPV